MTTMIELVKYYLPMPGNSWRVIRSGPAHWQVNVNWAYRSVTVNTRWRALGYVKGVFKLLRWKLLGSPW